MTLFPGCAIMIEVSGTKLGRIINIDKTILLERLTLELSTDYR